MSKRKYLLVCTLRRLSLDAWPSRPDKHVHPKVTHVYDDDGAASAAAAHSSRRGVASFVSAAAAATACQASAASAAAAFRCSCAAAAASGTGGGYGVGTRESRSRVRLICFGHMARRGPVACRYVSFGSFWWPTKLEVKL